ncbi:Tyrosine ammonia-lyase [Corynebacterium amycolatum]|nr:Tyrosine ammonia-lyase [Corynebacterium amycolatum]
MVSSDVDRNFAQKASYVRSVSELRRTAVMNDLEVVENEIKDRRVLVDRYVCSGANVYGFSTLLGHLDKYKSHNDSQIKLLDGHLIGPRSTITSYEFRVITLAKILQLAQGGSGVSIETFHHLVEEFESWDREAVGNWKFSYSSGDVVQGAWWAENICGELIRDSQISPGDLIALINGNFVSTGLAISLLTRMRRNLQSIVAIAALMGECSSCLYPNHGNRTSLGALWCSPVQAPVSIRDIRPVVESIQNIWRDLIEACYKNLHQDSFNPVFYVFDGQIRHASQSSFLNLGLAQVLGSSIEVYKRLAGYLQRFITHLCSGVSHFLNDYEKIPFVQPPKIAGAIVSYVEALNSGATMSYLAESMGIEDICDESLRLVDVLSTCIDLCEDLVNLFESSLDLSKDNGSYARLLVEAGVDPALKRDMGNQISDAILTF